MERKYLASVFWNGTVCEWAITSQEHYKKVEKLAHEMILTGLKEGEKLKEQISTYKEQLDLLEMKVCNGEKCNDKENTIWWLNVLALLSLGAIKNDDNYGTCIMDIYE